MSTHREQVIIGYGNRLRGDDGVGPMAAEAVQAWRLPGVRVVVVPQLLPEVIEAFKDAERVLFVDATLRDARPFACHGIQPMKSRSALGHYQSPGDLLALLQDLEGRSPPAWMLTISAASFDPGDGLTETARANMDAALAFVGTWLAEGSCTKSA